MAPRSKNSPDGAEIRRQRVERNWTQQRLCQEIRNAATDLGDHEPGVTVQMVSRWENGNRGLSDSYARLVETAFARTMNSDSDSWEHQMQRRAFLTNSAGVGLALLGSSLGMDPWQRLNATLQRRSNLDGASVDNLESMTGTFSEMFQTVAPAMMANPVRAHLETLTQLLADGSVADRLRRRLTSLASETSILLAWITQDQGDQGTAQNLYLSAIEAANEAGDQPLAAYAIASASTLDAFRSSPTESIHLLTDAKVRGASISSATPTTRAWIYSLEAEAHSRDNDADNAIDALDQADDLLADAKSEDDRRPRAAFFDTTRLTLERGVTAARLGMPDNAAEILNLAMVGLPDGHKIQSRAMTNLARARLAQGEIDEACSVAVRSLEIARATGTSSSVADVVKLRQQLNPWASLASVRDLDATLSINLA